MPIMTQKTALLRTRSFNANRKKRLVRSSSLIRSISQIRRLRRTQTMITLLTIKTINLVRRKTRFITMFI